MEQDVVDRALKRMRRLLVVGDFATIAFWCAELHDRHAGELKPTQRRQLNRLQWLAEQQRFSGEHPPTSH